VTVLAAVPATASAPATSYRRDRVVPEQHGAWAFMAFPVALAMTRTGWFMLLPAAALAWVAAYPVSWAATSRLTAARPERFDYALMTWAPIALLAAIPVVAACPWLVWVLVGYSALWLVSLGLARYRRERSLAGGLVLVAQCTLMIPVFLGIGTVEPGWQPPYDVLDAQVVLLLVACAAALSGSVLHVTSLMRERRDPRYAVASRAFAVAAALLVALAAEMSDASLWVVLPFVVLAARTWLVRGPGWRPAQLGTVELAGLVLVAVGVALA
jgi:hypothetical protein